jgi:3D (Asp-Asp-Asp) domain-containing protein
MKLKYLLLTSFIVFIYTINISLICFAAHIVDENWQPNFYKMQATAYCLTGLTATETQVRPGIVASKPEWFGKTVSIYLQDENGNAGEFLGNYVVEDTGGKAIRRGKVIDIWMPTEDECFAFGRRNVIVFINEGKP